MEGLLSQFAKRGGLPVDEKSRDQYADVLVLIAAQKLFDMVINIHIKLFGENSFCFWLSKTAKNQANYMNEQLKKLIIQGDCILLLGAGVSYGSKNSDGQDIVMAEGLSEILCRESGITYEPQRLPKIYSIAKDVLQARLIRIFEKLFAETTPSVPLNRLAAHVWPRIYTLNIDDAADRAFQRNSQQKVKIRGRYASWAAIDGLFKRLDIVKLNGCVHRPEDGFIFSPSEYASAANNPPEWYKQLGRDYLNYTFIFIGTRIDEPLFYQQIEYYKSVWSGSSGIPGRSFAITPTIDDIDKKYLATSNIEHIPATLEDFVRWLDSEVDFRRSPMQVAAIKTPELAMLTGDKIIEGDLAKIVKVSAILRPTADKLSGRTREFYLGFKPTWEEIFDGVPAEIGFHSELERSVFPDNRLHIIIGPAGSGKTTALMSLAAKLSISESNVYYLKEPISKLSSVIKSLEKVNDRPYYFFIDKSSSVVDGIIDVLNDGHIKNVIFVCGERLNVWRHRTEWSLMPFSPNIIKATEIDSGDAKKILAKLEQHGPWSRVSKMSPVQRTEELLEKSKRQLLIGLLELTTGYGFEKIIEDDFKKLESDEARLFVILVGLATVHDLAISKDLCLAALPHLGTRKHIDVLLSATHGIVNLQEKSLRARHSVYIDKLFDGRISLQLKNQALRALLMSMTRNEKPISKNMTRGEVMLFKYTVNYNFLSNFFHGKKDIILKLFEDFEKFFEMDGLYYLQYGLALRSFGMHDESLQKLRVAVDSWAMKQTEHAYAQQLLICASNGSKEAAYRNLELAKGILLRLDAGHDEEDTDYPLVTLAEYHVRISRRFELPDEVNYIANYYIREIADRQRRGRANRRLEDAKREIVRIATGRLESLSRKGNFEKRSNKSRASNKIASKMAMSTVERINDSSEPGDRK